MVRFGLCCQFADEPIAFRRLTATALQRCDRPEQLRRLAEVCLHNAGALRQALEYCARTGIGAFRVNSQILPLRTHPQVGYGVEELSRSAAVIGAFRACGAFAGAHGLRLSFHPDQFVVLSSPDDGVRERSVAELAYQAEVAGWLGADVINIHGGGGYGDKPAALRRLQASIEALPPAIRSRLTLENDERVYTPADLLPVCLATDVPLVYDVHHHRCHPDGLGVEDATRLASGTWGAREPLFHVSSPRDGWRGPAPEHHADLIDPADFPPGWRGLAVTVDIEAKAKERAVLRLMRDLAGA
jgi:UV DNA damage endonuclease